MTDTHTEHAADHHGPTVKIYIVIFVALSVFTAVSFIVNFFEQRGVFTVDTAVAIIMGVAVVKAFLVGLIFMHIKWDWYKLYFLIIPAFIVATMMMIVLLPDIVLAWPH